MNKRIDVSGLTDLAKRIHGANVEKGFWDEEREIGTLLMLVVSELAEALEAHRKDGDASSPLYSMLSDMDAMEDASFKLAFEYSFKDTFWDEISDAMIRLFDMCGRYGVDLDKHVGYKLRYNSLRGYKHGKKY